MRHPLESIPEAKKKTVFWSFFTATVLWMLLMQWVGMPLINQTAPSGIVSYELAGSVPAAQAILDSWNTHVQLVAAFSLGIDYVFIILYSTTFAMACLWSGAVLRQRGWPLGGLATGIAWGQWAAALFDAVENIALIVLLFGNLASPWPEIARWCAIFKFALLIIGLGYVLLGLVAYAVNSRRQSLTSHI